VIEAYINPVVNHSTEKFQWSRPNLLGLQAFLEKKIFWSESKTRQLLDPVIASWDEKTKQMRMDSFFLSENRVPTKINSTRLQKVISSMTNSNTTNSNSAVNFGEKKKTMKSKGKINKKKSKKSELELENIEDEDDDLKPKKKEKKG